MSINKERERVYYAVDQGDGHVAYRGRSIIIVDDKVTGRWVYFHNGVESKNLVSLLDSIDAELVDTAGAQ